MKRSRSFSASLSVVSSGFGSSNGGYPATFLASRAPIPPSAGSRRPQCPVSAHGRRRQQQCTPQRRRGQRAMVPIAAVARRRTGWSAALRGGPVPHGSRRGRCGRGHCRHDLVRMVIQRTRLGITLERSTAARTCTVQPDAREAGLFDALYHDQRVSVDHVPLWACRPRREASRESAMIVLHAAPAPLPET
jgi:hypothetical protein